MLDLELIFILFSMMVFGAGTLLTFHDFIDGLVKKKEVDVYLEKKTIRRLRLIELQRFTEYPEQDIAHRARMYMEAYTRWIKLTEEYEDDYYGL